MLMTASFRGSLFIREQKYEDVIQGIFPQTGKRQSHPLLGQRAAVHWILSSEQRDIFLMRAEGSQLLLLRRNVFPVLSLSKAAQFINSFTVIHFPER